MADFGRGLAEGFQTGFKIGEIIRERREEEDQKEADSKFDYVIQVQNQKGNAIEQTWSDSADQANEMINGPAGIKAFMDRVTTEGEGKLSPPNFESVKRQIEKMTGETMSSEMEKFLKQSTRADRNKFFKYVEYAMAGRGFGPALDLDQTKQVFSNPDVFHEAHKQSQITELVDVPMGLLREEGMARLRLTKLGDHAKETERVYRNRIREIHKMTGKVPSQDLTKLTAHTDMVKGAATDLRDVFAKQIEERRQLRTKVDQFEALTSPTIKRAVEQQRQLTPGVVSRQEQTSAAAVRGRLGELAAATRKERETQKEAVRRVASAEAVRNVAPGVLTASEREKMRSREIASQNYVDTTADALRMLKDNPDINTFVAGSARFINSLGAEIKAIANQFEVPFDQSQLDPSTYSGTFQKLGIQSGRMQSMITALGWMRAASEGQTGQGLSNRDIERFIGEIGASASDAETFAATLVDTAGRTVRRFKTEYRVRVGEEFPGDFGLGELENILSPEVPKELSSLKGWDKLSKEEQGELIKRWSRSRGR